MPMPARRRPNDSSAFDTPACDPAPPATAINSCTSLASLARKSPVFSNSCLAAPPVLLVLRRRRATELNKDSSAERTCELADSHSERSKADLACEKCFAVSVRPCLVRRSIRFWKTCSISKFLLAANNRLTGIFSPLNTYSGRLFLLILSGRVLSGIFSVIITSAWGPFGVYQERFQPDIYQAGRTRAV